MIKTVIPRQTNAYAAFPTFAQEGGQLYLYYRYGTRNKLGTHGTGGVVRCLTMAKDVFLERFSMPESEDLARFGTDRTVFAEGNEMDAIVSDLGGRTFSLATRSYDSQNRMRTFISLSDRPYFKDRVEVTIDGLSWFAFFGKGLRHGKDLVFPAYGALQHEDISRPLLLATRDSTTWELLSYLPSGHPGVILNESSLVAAAGRYELFMREDSPPFGIWHSSSPDLQKWRKPEKIIDGAHAPMAIQKDGRLWLAYRHILDEDRAATALVDPSRPKPPQLIETYEGSIYDGGYADPGFIDDRLFVFYYQGNRQGEPFIRCWHP